MVYCFSPKRGFWKQNPLFYFYLIVYLFCWIVECNASAVYFITMTSGEHVSTQKLILVKQIYLLNKSFKIQPAIFGFSFRRRIEQAYQSIPKGIYTRTLKLFFKCFSSHPDMGTPYKTWNSNLSVGTSSSLMRAQADSRSAKSCVAMPT